MWIDDEIFAFAVAWLVLTIFVWVWTVKIGLLLYRQRRAEVAYRLQLAAVRGAAVREMERESRAEPAEAR